jgi:hypothetical protein
MKEGVTMIKRVVGKNIYYDKNGVEITEGCMLRFKDGSIQTVYRTVENELGTDATNPIWIERGIAVPCEYGIYPLTVSVTEEVEVVR